MIRFNGDDCPVQRPYELFLGMLQLASDDCVAAMRQHIGNLSTSRLANVCADEITRRRRLRHEEEIKASAENAAAPR